MPAQEQEQEPSKVIVEIKTPPNNCKHFPSFLGGGDPPVEYLLIRGKGLSN